MIWAVLDHLPQPYAFQGELSLAAIAANQTFVSAAVSLLDSECSREHSAALELMVTLASVTEYSRESWVVTQRAGVPTAMAE